MASNVAKALTAFEFGIIRRKISWMGRRGMQTPDGDTIFDFTDTDGAWFGISYPWNSDKPVLICSPSFVDGGLPDLYNVGEVSVCEGTDTETPEEWCKRINHFFDTDFTPSSFAGR